MLTTRRSFVGVAGALATFLLAPFHRARGQTATSAPPATPTPPPAAKESGLARLARERYEKYLTTEELKMLDEEMASLERRSGRLRAVSLKNGEEPATDFRVRRT